MGERTHYEPGTFCWVGLATSDPAAAEGFYTSLFGWEAEELSAGGRARTRCCAERPTMSRSSTGNSPRRGRRGRRHLDLLHLGRGRRCDRRPGRRARWHCGVP
jgi:uncharacterized protein